LEALDPFSFAEGWRWLILPASLIDISGTLAMILPIAHRHRSVIL